MADTSYPASPSSDGFLRGQIRQTASGRLEAPESIIPNPTAARSIYFRLREDHIRRIQLYAEIEGLFSGNPPYDPKELEKHGLSHISNFNTLDARALYDRTALGYWNLLNETDFLVKFKIRLPRSEGVIPDLVKYADIMAEHWTDIVRQWPGFYTQVTTLTGQLTKLGISPCIWPDERDWRWRTIETSKFYVPDQALTDVERLTAICVDSTFTVQYLYETYLEMTKENAPKKHPWNIEELEELLIFRANSYNKDLGIVDMMSLQQRLQNRDIGYDVFFSDNVNLVSLFYQEYSGKISHYMFDRFFDKGNFLFCAHEQYDKLQEGIVIFTSSPGEFTIHSNRGLGHKIFSSSQAMMQLDCSIVDMAKWSSTPIIKRLPSALPNDPEAIRFTPGAPLDIGTSELQQNQLGANIQNLVATSNYLFQKMQFNAVNSGDDPGVPDKNVGSISPTEARIRAFKEFGVLKHYVAHFYSYMDIVYRNMVVKMLHCKKGYPGYEEAREWKERCMDDGVPEEVFDTGDNPHQLPRHLRVAASRVAGDGSLLARILGLQELAVDVGAFSAKGQKAYVRDKVLAVMGTEYVDEYLGDEQPDEASGGASLAGVENAVMQMGKSPVFSPDNENRSHIVTHFALIQESINQVQQQRLTPIEANQIMEVALPHVAEHIQALQGNPYEQGFLDKIKIPWKQMQDWANFNKKNANAQLQAELRKRDEDAQKTQDVMSDAERKDFVAQRDVERADFKVRSQVDRAAEANQTRAQVQRDKVQSDAQVQRERTILETQNERIKNKDKVLAEMSTEEIRGRISKMNGATPSPNDVEGT